MLCASPRHAHSNASRLARSSASPSAAGGDLLHAAAPARTQDEQAVGQAGGADLRGDVAAVGLQERRVGCDHRQAGIAHGDGREAFAARGIHHDPHPQLLQEGFVQTVTAHGVHVHDR